MTRDELKEDLAVAQQRVKALKDRLARHPETVKAYLPGDSPLWAWVTRVEAASGMTPHRKSPIEWDGFRFDLDGSSYWVRKGSNWCSDIMDVGRDGDEECPDLPRGVCEALLVDDEFVGAGVEALLETHPPHVVVGAALLVQMGVVG